MWCVVSAIEQAMCVRMDEICTDLQENNLCGFEALHDLRLPFGPITAYLYVRSSLQHTDFFARLCVVEPSGKSINLCDGIVRLIPGCVVPQADGSLRIQIDIWPTAQRFRRGQRIRIQVSSGAHPRFVRNSGTGEPLARATKLHVAEQSVFHHPET